MSLPMDLTEKMLSREEKYTGAFLSVHVDQVSLPNGHTSFREVVDHVDGVAVLPLDERNNVITVSQYRYVFGKTLLEIPAGKLDPGEEPAVGALRELREETGLDLGGAEPELLGTTMYEEEFVDTYAVRLPFALADVRPPRRGRESAPEGRAFCARRAK